MEAGASEDRDRRYLAACLDLARLGEGETSPNPMVGALLVKEGRILAQGYHRRAGDPHAEVEALESAGGEARGCTLYVNLEPCVHQGRTPPCTEAIILAGVAEVVACMTDPDPRVNGGGFRRLREAGVKVRSGILEGEALRLQREVREVRDPGRPVRGAEGGDDPGRKDRRRLRGVALDHLRGGALRGAAHPIPERRHPGGDQHGAVG